MPAAFHSCLLPGIDFAESQMKAFRRSLYAWYRRHGRRLPWRDRPSLYKTVVSEFMLQQTQVATVLPYFDRWMKRFPGFRELANAPEGDVLKHWEGLGYYNRARNLHRLARTVNAMAAIPESPEAWRELPGVGPYTAAAVTSIAFGALAACIDGNVVRILTRIRADGTAYRDGAAAARALAPLADALLPNERPGDHNQAMMELGATVCFRKRPLCTTCPVVGLCRAGRQGDPESYPVLAAKPTTRVGITRLWCRRGRRLLLHRTSGTARRLAGIYELPEPVHLGLAAADPADFGPVIARRKRAITRYRITETIHRHPDPPAQKALPDDSGLEWIPLDQLPAITLSGPHRKWVEELVAAEGNIPGKPGNPGDGSG